MSELTAFPKEWWDEFLAIPPGKTKVLGYGPDEFVVIRKNEFERMALLGGQALERNTDRESDSHG